MLILALVIAWFVLVAFLLYRETRGGVAACDRLATLSCWTGRRLWSLVRLLAVLLVVDLQIVRRGGSRARPAGRG